MDLLLKGFICWHLDENISAETCIDCDSERGIISLETYFILGGKPHLSAKGLHPQELCLCCLLCNNKQQQQPASYILFTVCYLILFTLMATRSLILCMHLDSGLLLCCLCSVWLAGTRPWVRFFSDAVRFTGGWTVIATSPPCSDHTNHPSALFKWKHFHSNPMQQRRHTNQRDVGAVPRKTKT